MSALAMACPSAPPPPRWRRAVLQAALTGGRTLQELFSDAALHRGEGFAPGLRRGPDVWRVLYVARLACRDLARTATTLVRVRRAVRRGWRKALGPLPCWRRAAALRIAAARLRVARRGDRGPLVDDLGHLSGRHPEDALRELPGRDEEWLAGFVAVLWPDGEYAEFLRCYPPDSGRGGDQQ